MKKLVMLLIILSLTTLLQGCFGIFEGWNGLERVDSKVSVYIYNHSTQSVEVKVIPRLAGLAFTPYTQEDLIVKAEVTAREDKKLIIDWDEIRNKLTITDEDGNEYSKSSGDIKLIVNYQKNDLIEIYLGRVKLYADGRNFMEYPNNYIKINDSTNEEGKLIVERTTE